MSSYGELLIGAKDEHPYPSPPHSTKNAKMEACHLKDTRTDQYLEVGHKISFNRNPADASQAECVNTGQESYGQQGSTTNGVNKNLRQKENRLDAGPTERMHAGQVSRMIVAKNISKNSQTSTEVNQV